MEKLAQNLIATLRKSLLVLDHDLRVRSANRSYFRTFGVEAEDVENRSIFELGHGQWDIPALRAALEKMVTHDAVLEDLVVEREFPGLGHKIMLLNVRCVERDAGAIPLILLAIDDVTEQRQVAATIEKYLHKLELSNHELEDFAYIASHDLQEPLRAIQAFSERLQSKHAHALDEQGLDYLARIQKAAGRMRHLIADLLLYSRVATQAKPFERVELGVVAGECVADLAKRLEDTGGQIEVGELPAIEADPIQMRQLLQNLFDNGLKFHREGEAPRVKIEARSAGSPGFAGPTIVEANRPFCYIAVQDNGIGFEEKYAERVFAPFERLHSQSRYPGTGIGLALCRRIVERHHGTLTVKSKLDEGTTFFIALPTQQPPTLEAPTQLSQFEKGGLPAK